RRCRGWWCRATPTRSWIRRRSTTGSTASRPSPSWCACPTPATSSTASSSTCAARSRAAPGATCRSPMAEAPAHALPSQAYRDGVGRGDWDDDPAQHAPLAALDRVHRELLATPRRGWLSRTFGSDAPAPRGLYLWGGVGRGKTFMVDLFYAGLPLPEAKLDAGRGDGNGKRRTHFHRFMRVVHERLREHAGERDPLAAIVAEWRRSLRVLVLDEFFVSDIGDAMLLARVLERMFAEGIVLVTTSNIAPAGLYADGLQRARFLPAIALLEQHCQVLEIISDTDYRLRELTRSPVYRAPLDAQ